MKYLIFLLFISSLLLSCQSSKEMQAPSQDTLPKLSIDEATLPKLVSQSAGLSLEDFDQSIPYFQIPDAPDNFSAGAVLARTIDGLGYRYYWATHGLRSEDLQYNPGNEGRSTEETLEHLYGLSSGLMHAAQQAPNPRPLVIPEVPIDELRALTLQNLKIASDIFRRVEDVSPHKIIFQRGENTSEFPVWNVMNGFLADAIYHTGQIVSYRRSSGNPQHPGVSVFMGKTKL